MNRLFLSAILVIATCWGGLSASVQAEVQVQEANGTVKYHIWGAPTPTPGYCYWENEIPAPFFHATEINGYGNMECPHPWLAHCDSDSMAFHATWPALDYEYLTGAEYLAELYCTVTVSEQTTLVASRTVEGNLDTDEHTMVLDYPDGTQAILLATDSAQDQAQLELLPGTYVVRFSVHAYENLTSNSALTPYFGSMTLRWEPGSVTSKPVTWDSFKASFGN